MLKNQFIDVKSFLLPDPEDTAMNFMTKEPFFRWALNNSDLVNGKLEEAMAILLKKIGTEYTNDYIEAFCSNDLEKKTVFLNKVNEADLSQNIDYTTLSFAGYTGDERSHIDPVNSVVSKIVSYRLKVRGFSANFNGTVAKLESEQMLADYIRKRFPVVVDKNGKFYRYDFTGVYVEISEDLVKKTCKYVIDQGGPGMWNIRMEAKYYPTLLRDLPVIDQFDAEPDIINVQNGLFNIRTMKLKPHTAEFVSRIQIPIEYNPEASCLRFKQYLDEVFEGDEHRILLIQEILGYGFLKDIKIQKAFIFLGSGANGKSVLSEVMHRLYGRENVSNTSLKRLTGNFGMQDLPGKLMNISSENQLNGDFNTENFKALTAGDTLQVERKYADAFSTRIIAKTVILLNSMMDSSDTTNGFYRRLLIVPFNRKFHELKQNEERKPGIYYMDPDLIDKLASELSGILNFALEGLQRLRLNDFQLTASLSCSDALQQYIATQNPISEFVEDVIVGAPGERILRPDLTRIYKEWLSKSGISGATTNSQKVLTAIKSELTTKGIPYEEVKIKGQYYFNNINVKNDIQDVMTYVSALK